MEFNPLIVIGIGAGLYFLLSDGLNGGNGSLNLDLLTDQYGTAKVSRLKSLLSELDTFNLTLEQKKYLLSQAIHETGLFTSNPNYNAIDNRRNWAGLMLNGAYKVYNNLHDFIASWISPVYLNKGSFPLQASSIDDFNTRLKANGYYTDSVVTYGNALRKYYNILNSL